MKGRETILMISIIMLTYNREIFVSRAINSILSQTFKDFEFIIVDNGSTDCSGVIADEYAEKDKRIRVIHRERGSIGAGRNTGLDAVNGEYIAFIDDDDWCEPDFLEFLYNLAIKNDVDVAICGVNGKIFDDIEVMTPETAVSELLWRKKYNVGFPTKLIKRELLSKNRFNPESRYDDIYLMPIILSAANRIAYHGLPKYNVLRHENNNSAWITNHSLITAEILNEYLNVYQERTEWLCNRFPNNTDIWRYFEWSFMISMLEKITRLNLQNCFEIRDELLGELQGHKNEFLNTGYALDYEIEWMKVYVEGKSDD